MKSILAHLGIVALVLLWIHFKQKPSTSVLPSPQPTVTPSVKAKTTPPPQTCEVPKRIDPHEIARWISDHPNCAFQSVLTLLNAESEFHSDRLNGQLKTQILDLDLDANVLEVTSGIGSATEFYFFSHADRNTNYRFLGKAEPLDYIFSYRIVVGEAQSWFVIRDRWVRGSGAWLRGETWYEVTDSSVNQVLSFPVNGCELDTRSLKSRFFDATAVSHEIINGRTTIKVKLNVNYTFFDDPSEVFLSKSDQEIYVRNNVTGEFKKDKKHSTLTDEESESIYSIESLDDPKFLKYNFAELTQIASRGSKQQKKALKEYLLALPKLKRAQSLLAKLH